MTTALRPSTPPAAPPRGAAGGPSIRLPLVLVGGIALLLALHGAMLVARYVFHWESAWGLLDAIDLGQDLGIGTWWQSGVLALGAGAAVAIGTLAERRLRGRWVALGLLLGALSVDEVATIHDDISDPLEAIVHLGGVFHYVWVIPGMAILAAFVVWQWPFLARLAPASRRGLALGAGVYVVGAVGFEMLESLIWEWTHEVPTIWIYLNIAAEETLEMVGAALVLVVLLRHLTGGRDLPVTLGGHPFQVELAPHRR